MEYSGKKKNTKGILAVVMLTVLGVWIGLRARKAVAIFAAAFILAYLLDPLVKVLQKQGLKRLWAILWVYGVGVFVLSGILTMVLPYLVQQVNEFLLHIPNYAKAAQDWYDKSLILYEKYFSLALPKEALATWLNTIKESMGLWLAESMKRMGHFAVDGVIWLLVPVVSFYLLKDKDQIRGFVYRFLPLRRQNEWKWLFGEVDAAVKGFLRGSVAVGGIVGIFTTVGLWLVGVKFSLLFGLIAGIFNIIPYFGPFIGGAPAVIGAFFQEPIKGLWAGGVILLVQQVESHFVTPKVMGDKLGLHPLAIMFALLAAGMVAGLWGLVLAVPLVGVMRVVIRFIIDESVSVQP